MQNIAISMGRLGFIGSQSVLKPPSKIHKGTCMHFPIKIGDFVSIGSGCEIEAASIGNCVKIGKNCRIVHFKLIKRESL